VYPNSRRESMFIGNAKPIYPNPEGILCKKTTLKTYNPFGIKEQWLGIFYKHRFPSGIWRHLS
jgi:hypothetical protein